MMLADIYYIIPFTEVGQLGPAGEDCVLAIELQPSGDQLIAGYKSVRFNALAAEFCLLVDGLEQVDGSIAYDLAAFFFLPNYKKKHGLPVVLVQGKETAQAFRNLMRPYIKAQGFGDANGECLCVVALADATVCSAADVDQIGIQYRNILSEHTDDRDIYIRGSGMADIARAHQILEHENEKLRKEEGHSFQLQQENRMLRKETEALKKESRAAAEEIRNQNIHMNILRSNSQATHLQRYYDLEYEVLPLWYKQFGHVLKVLTGKRTLRSLFNKNAKKYRK